MKDLFGEERWPDAVKDQLREIMLDYPKTIDDEDLLAAYWLGDSELAPILRKLRKADIPRRRRELRTEFPYSDEEEARRQKAARR